MDFVHYKLGSLSKGQIVKVILKGNAANVLLLDNSNFNNYKNGRKYSYYGGHATRSPVIIPVPRSGIWHVAINLGGHGGRINSAVNVLPGAMPEIRNTPLSDVPSLVQRNDAPNHEEVEREFDVFISHASEDKNVVRPLANALKANGLKVWYDEFELEIGDSLRRKIDKGLAKSRFGVVVLSKSFFGKGWANYELDGLVTKSATNEQILLPIWHDITKQELINYSPSLADKVARSTATNTVEEIAKEIADIIQQDGCR